jgi:phospholipid transport system substrate-binding protein
MIMRTTQPLFWSTALLLFGLLSAAEATTEAATETPDITMQRLTAKVFERLEAKEAFMKANPDQVQEVGRELVDEFVLPFLDMTLMSRWIIGKSWRSATPKQRERFQNEFTNMLIRTYASALLEFRGKQVLFKPFHHDPKRKDAVVKAEFSGDPGAPVVPVLFRVRIDTQQQWKVFDIIVDGVSLVKNYRSSFGAEIRKVGLEGLIERLSTHNSEQHKG